MLFGVWYVPCVTDEIWRYNGYCILRVKLKWIPGSPGIVANVYRYPGYCAALFQKSHKFWERVRELIERAEVPGTGTKALQNLQKFRVR